MGLNCNPAGSGVACYTILSDSRLRGGLQPTPHINKSALLSPTDNGRPNLYQFVSVQTAESPKGLFGGGIVA